MQFSLDNARYLQVIASTQTFCIIYLEACRSYSPWYTRMPYVLNTWGALFPRPKVNGLSVSGVQLKCNKIAPVSAWEDWENTALGTNLSQAEQLCQD